MAELRGSSGTTGDALAGSSSRLLGGPRRIFHSRSEQIAAIKKEVRMFGLLLGVCYFRCFGRKRRPHRGGGDLTGRVLAEICRGWLELIGAKGGAE